MSRYKLVTTAKLKGVTEEVVSASAAKAYPGYRVASVEDKGDKWEIRLDQATSNRTRQAGPPPAFLDKDKKDDAGAPDDEESKESPEEEAEEDSGEKPDDDAESKDDSDKPKGEGDSKKKDPVAAINEIMGELQSLLDQLGGHAAELKEKGDKVDEIHELTKGTGDVDSMEGVPPVPALDDPAAVGPTPGGHGLPVPPRKPPIPGGAKRPGVPPGAQGVFGSNEVEVVEHPIKDDDGEYGLGDVLAAVSSHPSLANYKVDELKAVAEQNKYVATLTRK